MTILFDATRPVKTSRPARRFGAGLLATLPTYRTGHTSADAVWWAAESARLEDARFDRTAGESAFMDRYEAGRD